MRHLQSFKYVKKIAEVGSIRGAAESLTISPSALNRHIQTLELDLDLVIFERLTKGVRLSTEGELFYQFALRQLSSFQQLKSQINDIKGLRTGVVRICVSTDLSLKFLHSAIAEFQNSYGDVAFEVCPIGTNELEMALMNNHFDIALFYQPVLGQNLQVIHTIEAPIHVAMPNGAPVSVKAGIKLYEIIDQPALMPPKGTQLRIKIDAACERIGINLRQSMECTSPLDHLDATQKSRVAFCLPFDQDFIEYHKRGYKLVPIASKELALGYINLISHTHGQISVATQKFIKSFIARMESTEE
jgi:DNA-binding transcriptional LysR family regulator